MNAEMVFDVGMHLGEDTAYYLSKGYTVIAVDADENLVHQARAKFADAVQQARLILVHRAVAMEDGEVEQTASLCVVQPDAQFYRPVSYWTRLAKRAGFGRKAIYCRQRLINAGNKLL